MASESQKQYVYGPVPSRRLGQSLGVDPIPFKACNYNCVYCQLGRTQPVVHERRDYFPPQEILRQVQDALTQHQEGGIDYVTFVGQGEPTLCASLGKLIRGVKAMCDIPVAVITNGALMCRADVRAELLEADLIVPSLDAATQESFRRINRPWPRFRIQEIIKGMATFREEYGGQLWIEVMLVKGLNDDHESLLALGEALAQINPDRVQINIPVRPPAETWVEVPTDIAISHAVDVLGRTSQVVAPYEGHFDFSGDVDPANAILSIIRRHPMREQRVIETLDKFVQGDVESVMQSLLDSGRAQRRVYHGQVFWEAARGDRGVVKKK